MKFLKDNWPFLMPAAFVLTSPWFFRLSYENIKLAVPGVSDTGAQNTAWFLTIGSIFVLFIVAGTREGRR